MFQLTCPSKQCVKNDSLNGLYAVFMMGLGALTMLIIHYLPKLAVAVPASLATFVFVTVLVVLFDPKNDPEELIIDVYNPRARVADHSGLECQSLLDKAGDLVKVNLMKDPKYQVMVNRLA